jgi:hypothetical protein
MLEEIRRFHKWPQLVEINLLGNDPPDRLKTEKPAQKIIKKPLHVWLEFGWLNGAHVSIEFFPGMIQMSADNSENVCGVPSPRTQPALHYISILSVHLRLPSEAHRAKEGNPRLNTVFRFRK